MAQPDIQGVKESDPQATQQIPNNTSSNPLNRQQRRGNSVRDFLGQQSSYEIRSEIERIHGYESPEGSLEENLEPLLEGLEQFPKRAEFPTLIFMAAVTKDILDIFTGGLVSVIFAAILGLILWLWWFSKTSFIKKYLRKWIARRVIAFFIADSVPIVSIFVPTSLFIVLWYNREKKIVQIISNLLFLYTQAVKVSAQQTRTASKKVAPKPQGPRTIDTSAFEE